MESYKYVAQAYDGSKHNGVVEASDQYDAITKIKVNYPIVETCTLVKKTKLDDILGFELTKSLTGQDLALLCQQCAIILKSGVSVGQCMTMVAEQTKKKKLKKELTKASEDINQGNSISKAFEKNCPDFPVTFFETIRAGEASGNLVKSFETLEGFYIKSDKVKKKLKSALSYPIFVLCVAIVVVIIIMAFVVPSLTQTFTDMGGELPVITKILIVTSQFFQNCWLGLFIGIAVIIVAFKYITHTEWGKLWWSKTSLKIPIIGNIQILHACEQFADTLSSLMASGILIDSAIETTAKVMDNYIYKREVFAMAEKIRTGKTMVEAMNPCPYFPDIMKTMVAVGEQTGSIEMALQTIAVYYTTEYDNATQKALSKLEPTMMIFLALFAGFIVISIYLPMFTMYDLF